MQQSHNPKVHIPISEALKSIPGVFGIRLANEPKYTVVDMENEKELRLYEKMNLATITVTGSYEIAMNEGFTRLTQYVFGDNTTSEVLSILMPIFEEQNGNTLTMSLILPKNLTVTMAPIPHDQAISISEKAEHTAAVIWYTGKNDTKRIHKKSAELYRWLNTKEAFKIEGPLKIAQYDAPMSLPFFRRNELHVEVALTH